MGPIITGRFEKRAQGGGLMSNHETIFKYFQLDVIMSPEVLNWDVIYILFCPNYWCALMWIGTAPNFAQQ